MIFVTHGLRGSVGLCNIQLDRSGTPDNPAGRECIMSTRSSIPVSEWMTTGQAATALGISRRTVRRWCSDGTIRQGRWVVTAKGHRRIDPAEVNRLRPTPGKNIDQLMRDAFA